VFQFKRPDVPFETYVLGAYIVPQHLWKNLGDPAKVVLAKPVGTGPYLLNSFNPQNYTYTANDQFWGGVPPVKNLDYPAYASGDATDLGLAKGQIDWGGLFMQNIQQLYAAKSPYNHYWFPPGNVVMLYTDLKDPLLSQLPVRQAISLAINREQLYKLGEYGYAPVASPTGLVLPNNQAWLDPGLPPSDLPFSFDPTKAVQILEKAGFKKNSQGIFEKGGRPLSLTLQVVAGWPDWDTDCQLIQEQLQKIGIQVKVEEDQYGAYYNNLTAKTPQYQLAISWTNVGPTPYFLYQNMLSPKGNFNVERLNDPHVTARRGMSTTTRSGPDGPRHRIRIRACSPGFVVPSSRHDMQINPMFLDRLSDIGRRRGVGYEMVNRFEWHRLGERTNTELAGIHQQDTPGRTSRHGSFDLNFKRIRIGQTFTAREPGSAQKECVSMHAGKELLSLGPDKRQRVLAQYSPACEYCDARKILRREIQDMQAVRENRDSLLAHVGQHTRYGGASLNGHDVAVVHELSCRISGNRGFFPRIHVPLHREKRFTAACVPVIRRNFHFNRPAMYAPQFARRLKLAQISPDRHG
jgi:hypothetical protein